MWKMSAYYGRGVSSLKVPDEAITNACTRAEPEEFIAAEVSGFKWLLI